MENNFFLNVSEFLFTFFLQKNGLIMTPQAVTAKNM